MSHVSSSIDSISGGYAKYRAGRGSRQLAEDSAVFSLDEDGDIGCSNNSLRGVTEGEKSRLVECSLDSEGDEDDIEIERRKRINRVTPTQNRVGSTTQSQVQESKSIGKVDNSLTRLTSSSIYDLDADEVDSVASDELDLLPPINSTSTGQSSTLMSLSSIFQCCKPRRIPFKCTIL